MYHKHHTRGIVIYGKNEGDSNKFVNIFTESFGLIGAKVQGARKTGSRLRAGVQDFSVGDFSLIHGKTGWKLVSAKIERNLFEEMRHSPKKIMVINNVLNLIKKISGENARVGDEISRGERSSLFEIVTNFQHFLISAKENEIDLAECLTLLRILYTLGYVGHDPELDIAVAVSEIEIKDLENLAPRRSKIVNLINESLKSA